MPSLHAMPFRAWTGGRGGSRGVRAPEAGARGAPECTQGEPKWFRFSAAEERGCRIGNDTVVLLTAVRPVRPVRPVRTVRPPWLATCQGIHCCNANARTHTHACAHADNPPPHTHIRLWQRLYWPHAAGHGSWPNFKNAPEHPGVHCLRLSSSATPLSCSWCSWKRTLQRRLWPKSLAHTSSC